MNYGAIKEFDIADGPGVRVSLFVSGCRNHCQGCFQPDTWNFQYGEPFTEETADHIIEALKPSYIQGFSLLGGEPFEPENQQVLVNLLRRIHHMYPEKDVWCYTGYTLESDLLDPAGSKHTDVTDEMLSYIDVLVDGHFVLELKDITLQYRGSSNQRVLNLAAMREAGTKKAIWWPVHDRGERLK